MSTEIDDLTYRKATYQVKEFRLCLILNGSSKKTSDFNNVYLS